jgi:hypothetical protein
MEVPGDNIAIRFRHGDSDGGQDEHIEHCLQGQGASTSGKFARRWRARLRLASR